MGNLFSTPAPTSRTKPPEPNRRRYRINVYGLDGAGKTAILHRLTYSPYSSTIPAPSSMVIEPSISVDFGMLPNNILSPHILHHHNTNNDTNTGTSTNTKTSIESETDIGNIKLLFYDIAGRPRFRHHVHTFLEGSSSMIYVIDAADRSRFQESVEFLHMVLDRYHPRVGWRKSIPGWRALRSYEIPLLILANKMDQSEAMTAKEVMEGLELHRWTEPGWRDHTEEDRLNEERRRWCLWGCSAVRGEGLIEGIEWLVVQMEGDRRRKEEEERSKVGGQATSGLT